MEAWAAIVKTSLDRSELLATAGGDEAAAFRSSHEDLPTARDRYFAIPRSERLYAWRVDYTRAWLEEFADDMAFQLLWGELEPEGDQSRQPA